MYSLPFQNDCPTSYIFQFQNDCSVYLRGQKLEAQSQIFLHQTLYIKQSFNTATSEGISEQSLFSILTVIRQLFDQWSADVNLTKVRNTNNHFGTACVVQFLYLQGFLLTNLVVGKVKQLQALAFLGTKEIRIGRQPPKKQHYIPKKFVFYSTRYMLCLVSPNLFVLLNTNCQLTVQCHQH